MTDNSIKQRVRKLEQKKKAPEPFTIEWIEYDPNNPLEDQEPPPGETWIIWTQDDKIIKKRGKRISSKQ